MIGNIQIFLTELTRGDLNDRIFRCRWLKLTGTIKIQRPGDHVISGDIYSPSFSSPQITEVKVFFACYGLVNKSFRWNTTCIPGWPVPTHIPRTLQLLTRQSVLMRSYFKWNRNWQFNFNNENSPRLLETQLCLHHQLLIGFTCQNMVLASQKRHIFAKDNSSWYSILGKL